MYFKPHDIRVLLLFIFVTLGLYVFFVLVIARGISGLNIAREEELKAITMQQDLLRREYQTKNTLNNQ